ncbi:hypothetical protein [Epibacterium ulvae]|uniref:hypothetical protein n=1 Tax=Epibacterium ulvae TaxID=1156985 RepID=UPI00249061E4|nr:hypothetical protein [Epibacterium ulvae]
MSKATKNVTLSIYQAVIDDSVEFSVAQILSVVRESLQPGEHVLSRGLIDQATIDFPSFPQTNDAVGMHIALQELGRKQTTVATNTTTASYEKATVPAPGDTEFLTNEISLLAVDNTLVICNLNKRENLIIDVILRTAEKCGINLAPTAVTLVKPANELTLEKIREQGVRSVKVDAYKLLSQLGATGNEHLDSLLGSSAAISDYQQEDVVANIEVRSRKIGKSRVEYSHIPKSYHLQRAAELTWESKDIDSYTIILNDGTPYSESAINLNKKVSLLTDGGTSYNKSEALYKMLEYLKTLRENGHLK